MKNKERGKRKGKREGDKKGGIERETVKKIRQWKVKLVTE